MHRCIACKFKCRFMYIYVYVTQRICMQIFILRMGFSDMRGMYLLHFCIIFWMIFCSCIYLCSVCKSSPLQTRARLLSSCVSLNCALLSFQSDLICTWRNLALSITALAVLAAYVKGGESVDRSDLTELQEGTQLWGKIGPLDLSSRQPKQAQFTWVHSWKLLLWIDLLSCYSLILVYTWIYKYVYENMGMETFTINSCQVSDTWNFEYCKAAISLPR